MKSRLKYWRRLVKEQGKTDFRQQLLEALRAKQADAPPQQPAADASTSRKRFKLTEPSGPVCRVPFKPIIAPPGTLKPVPHPPLGDNWYRPEEKPAPEEKLAPAPTKKKSKRKVVTGAIKRGRKPYPIWERLFDYLTSEVTTTGKKYRLFYDAARAGLNWLDDQNKNKPLKDRFVVPDFDTVRDKIRAERPDLVEESGDQSKVAAARNSD